MLFGVTLLQMFSACMVTICKIMVVRYPGKLPLWLFHAISKLYTTLPLSLQVSATKVTTQWLKQPICFLTVCYCYSRSWSVLFSIVLSMVVNQVGLTYRRDATEAERCVFLGAGEGNMS